ncbi:MAG: hypothetical protein QOE33_1871 [Acidobacteriota bacterium]|nr:hypothetical protein [Acidobacteriota bacterium]
MKSTERRSYEMFVRAHGFGETKATAFPPSTSGGALFAQLGAVVAELDSHTEAQVAHRSEAAQGATSKDAARKALRADLKAISDTAHALSFSKPGLQERFRLPRGNNDQSLLIAARDFRTNAELLKADFTRLELPADFLDTLQARIDAFEQGLTGRNANRVAQVTATSAIANAIERGLALVRQLDAVVRNKFRDDPVTLAAWESASHVQHLTKRRTSPKGSTASGDAKP